MDVLIVAALIAGALAYSGWKAWKMLKPGPKGGGCGCSSAGAGCAGCPVMDLKRK